MAKAPTLCQYILRNQCYNLSIDEVPEELIAGATSWDEVKTRYLKLKGINFLDVKSFHFLPSLETNEEDQD